MFKLKNVKSYIHALCLHTYSSRTIVADFRHRFTVINMNDTPVPIDQIHSFQSIICITVNL